MIWMFLIFRVLLDFGSKIRTAAPMFALDCPRWLLAATVVNFTGWGERATNSGREPPDWMVVTYRRNAFTVSPGPLQDDSLSLTARRFRTVGEMT